MNCTEAEQRIGLSIRIISAWERLGRPGTQMSDPLKMIAEELAVLEGIAADHPPMAKQVEPVANRYRALQLGLKTAAD